MSCFHTLASFSLAAAVAVTAAAGAQPQAPNARAGWPCGARLDPSYFDIAEGTGGHLLLLAPEEIGDAAAVLTALGDHRETIARIAGAIQPGLQEFSVPIDSSVESVLFSMSVQCLQLAEVVRPSGAPAIGDGIIDLSSFRAERMVVVRQPEPGTWKVRIAGSGIGGIVVQARSAIGIAQLGFASPPGASFRAVPRAGVENAVRIRMDGDPPDVRAYLVNATLERLVELASERSAIDGTFVSRVIPGTAPFRVLVTGRDAAGQTFQRVTAPLLTATR
jgi:hypothetical protein